VSGALLAGVAAVGCTGDSSDSATRATSDAGGGLADTPSEAAELDLDRVERPERQVIHQAELTVRTNDVEEAASEATRIVEDASGYVDSQDADLEGTPHVTLVLKVPPPEYRRALASLEALGDVTSRSERTEDVTQQVVDLEARIEAARSSTSRLRELLEGSGSLDDIVKLERELATREADLDSLVAIAASLEAQVDYATIALRIDRPAKTASSGEPSEKIPGFLRGLKTGWGAFVNVALGIVTAFGFLLPFLAAAAVVTAIARPLVHRSRRRTALRAERELPLDDDDHAEWLVADDIDS